MKQQIFFNVPVSIYHVTVCRFPPIVFSSVKRNPKVEHVSQKVTTMLTHKFCFIKVYSLFRNLSLIFGWMIITVTEKIKDLEGHPLI